MDNKRIIFQNAEGGVSVIIPAPGVSQADVLKAVPPGARYEIVDAADIPADRTFRNAWFHDTTPAPQKVGVDVDKAKAVCHDKRRAKRAEEFAPLDVQATIPAKAAQAEAARQAIRDKHAAIQAEIDAAADAAALKAILEREGQNTSGVEQYLCKAWVNFNGTGTVAIRASGNVSSITDNGTGDYTVNFTNAMPDSNYLTSITAAGNRNATDQMLANVATNGDAASTNPELYSTTQVRIRTGNTSATFTNRDVTYIGVAIFR